MTPITLAALIALQPDHAEETDFAKLSQPARDAIIAAVMGEDPLPELTEEVKREIAQWAAEPE